MAHVIERVPLGSPSLGTERVLTVHRFGTAGARPKAYLHAGLHAAELPGIVVLEHLLNRLEAAIRCYDPCLSCSTHALGQMPLVVEVRGPDGKLVRTLQRGV